MENCKVLTIDKFNKLTGNETLHPLVGMVDLSRVHLDEDIRMACDFYGLLYYNSFGPNWLRLVCPGDFMVIPSNGYCSPGCYSGVLFHPDLLYGTSLENQIKDYPKFCSCQDSLSTEGRRVVAGCLREIGEELHHAIDNHSALIVVSHIELLLNYSMRFCSQ